MDEFRSVTVRSEIACDIEGRPLIASAPDDLPRVVVASAAVHRRRGPG